MEILAHRGCWNDKVENNSFLALKAALEKGFGFESDIRDYKGELVISHNIAEEECQCAEDIVAQLAEFDDRFRFAINIKADGLAIPLGRLLDKYGIRNYFTFDMSVPQMIEYSEMGLTFFTRQSEFEKEPVLYDKADGVWIDSFYSDLWVTEDLLKFHIQNGKKICIVSPELHKRKHMDFWVKLKGFNIDLSAVILCTDYPDDAKKFLK